MTARERAYIERSRAIRESIEREIKRDAERIGVRLTGDQVFALACSAIAGVTRGGFTIRRTDA